MLFNQVKDRLKEGEAGEGTDNTNTFPISLVFYKSLVPWKAPQAVSKFAAAIQFCEDETEDDGPAVPLGAYLSVLMRG